jgi:hypothetical protein
MDKRSKEHEERPCTVAMVNRLTRGYQRRHRRVLEAPVEESFSTAHLPVLLLIAYSIYSLVHETHKSWYSFIITTLVGSDYANGFLTMVPSLYIHCHLTSVVHISCRAMTLRFLNTFIDDLFAFIKVPTLHRLTTFRGDNTFSVYLSVVNQS